MYLANPCGPAVIAAMRDRRIGMIDQPNQNKVTWVEAAHAAGALWAADNGAFSDRFDVDRWWAFLVKNADRTSTCLFAAAPDVVGDATATMRRSQPWLSKMRQLGYPAAFVAQDGAEHTRLPWDEFDALFIGGTTEWKVGPHARALVAAANAHGKHVHMGRVNSERRFKYAADIGCDSCDGTYLTFGPDTNLPRLLAWTRLNEQGVLFGGAS